MNLGEIYALTRYRVNQDQLGDMPRPEDFNVMLKSANLKLFEQEWDFLLRLHNEKGFPISDLIENTDSLRPFVVYLEYAELSSGIYTMPDNFKYPISAEVYIYNSYTMRDCDILSELKYSKRRKTVLTESPHEKPFGQVSGGKFYVVPITAPYFHMRYLRVPVDPKFDCCMTTGGDLIYMPVGSRLVSIGPMYNLRSSTGETLETNVVHYLSTTTYPYISTSVELEWSTTEHNAIVDLLVSMIAERNREFNIVQLNKKPEQK